MPATGGGSVFVLSEGGMRRVRSYAIGQVAVASVNAFFLADDARRRDPVCRGARRRRRLPRLVPMVGATLGAVVGIVRSSTSRRRQSSRSSTAIVYQQLENLRRHARIMQRTVSVPGAVTVVAAMTGGALMGMLGALIAIPAAAGLLLIYEEVIVPARTSTKGRSAASWRPSGPRARCCGATSRVGDPATRPRVPPCTAFAPFA